MGKFYFEQCPSCKSSKYETITPNNAGFHMWSCGGVYLNVCLDCGCVYLPAMFLEKAKKKHKEKERNDKART